MRRRSRKPKRQMSCRCQQELDCSEGTTGARGGRETRVGRKVTVRRAEDGGLKEADELTDRVKSEKTKRPQAWVQRGVVLGNWMTQDVPRSAGNALCQLPPPNSSQPKLLPPCPPECHASPTKHT